MNIIIKTEDNEKSFELPKDQSTSYKEKQSPAQTKSNAQNVKSKIIKKEIIIIFLIKLNYYILNMIILYVFLKILMK